MVKMAIKKLTDTLEKTHASFPMSTVRIEMQKSAQYKWSEGISHSFMHTMTVRTLSFIDAQCMIIQQ